MNDATSEAIVHRLRGAADYRFEFGPIEGADIYLKAAEEIERLRSVSQQYRDALEALIPVARVKVRNGDFALANALNDADAALGVSVQSEATKGQ